MGKLSELVKRDYDLEVGVIKDTGDKIWSTGIGLAIGLVGAWISDAFLFGDRWSKREIIWAIVFVVAFPFIRRAWDRHKVAALMRHQREVRMEIKLDALLGLVNFKDDEYSA